MLTDEQIQAVYDQGPGAVIALVESLRIQIAELRSSPFFAVNLIW